MVSELDVLQLPREIILKGLISEMKGESTCQGSCIPGLLKTWIQNDKTVKGYHVGDKVIKELITKRVIQHVDSSSEGKPGNHRYTVCELELD